MYRAAQTRQRRCEAPKAPIACISTHYQGTNTLTRTNGCTETGEKLTEAATLNCLHQATTCGCIASCVPALCAVCRSAFGPEQVRNTSKSLLFSHTRTHTSLFSHSLFSNSIPSPSPSFVQFPSRPSYSLRRFPPCLFGPQYRTRGRPVVAFVITQTRS